MFLKVKTSEEVLEILKGFDPVSTETILIADGFNRILNREIVAEEDLPNFRRSTMDGYALRACDTFGASENLPVFLELVGEVAMGQIPTDIVTPGRAVRISTGGMIPEGADAVVMIEYCHHLDEKTIEVSRAVSPLENVVMPGDDFKKGVVIFEKGAILRPQDIGILAGLGIQNITVYKKPKVAIISTGDEIIPINQSPKPGQVRDINSYTLSAFCSQAGAIPVNLGLCKDNFSDLSRKVAGALETCDTVWISGGSSVGVRDMTLKVLESFDHAQLLVHGIAVSPGKPAIISRIGNKAVFGLPGHVASAMVVAEIFLNPFLSRLSGVAGASDDHHFYLRAELTRNIESAGGRDDYIRVRLDKRDGRIFAEPIFGKSGLISTLVEAHGLLKIDRNTEGLYKGQTVEVMLFKPFT
ncbi:MAG: molybdopterin molybdenumtransferase MoeA [Deltaproteobacteria bacterium HGW-Deltaproteobacteria-6]|nr:MAG: molybdopterin molybdenumtransferase MoeA [Deltaproteobacteria bacterium HGW-Deltaproteobacteria-6]